MKTFAVLALFLASAAAFNAPQFATRAVSAKVKKGAKAKPATATVSYCSSFSPSRRMFC
jgi:hypothetical protein